MTQVGQEPLPVSRAASPAAAAPPGRGPRVRVTAGTLMQKPVPPELVEPYLTSQRSVITGFVHRAEDSLPAGLPWPGDAAGRDVPGGWVLRWRALEIQAYRRACGPAAPAGLFLEPGAIPVGAEMYRITAAGEELIARHDGQAWLRPGPGS